MEHHFLLFSPNKEGTLLIDDRESENRQFLLLFFFSEEQYPTLDPNIAQRDYSEKSKDPAPMGTGNLDVVNFTAETILKWTIGSLSSI